MRLEPLLELCLRETTLSQSCYGVFAVTPGCLLGHRFTRLRRSARARPFLEFAKKRILCREPESNWRHMVLQNDVHVTRSLDQAACCPPVLPIESVLVLI